MERRMLLGSALAVVAAGALVAVVTPVLSGSDAATTEIRVAAATPEPPAAGALPRAVAPRWSAPTGPVPATGAAVGPTVVVSGPDLVAGLDPETGRERWSYRRGNARLCGWVGQDGAVLAAFDKGHGCRDLTALDAGTGARRWYRTLEFTSDVRLLGSPGVAVAYDEDKLIAVDPATGLNRWTYEKDGCRFVDPPFVGQLAVLLVADCANGTRLISHDTFAEKERWSVPAPAGARPKVVGADGVIAVLTGPAASRRLEFYDVEGKRQGTLSDPRLRAGAAGPGAPSGLVSGTVLMVWTGSTVVAVDTGQRVVLWSAAAAGPPVLDGGRVLLAGPRGLTGRAVPTGAGSVGARYLRDPPPATATLARVGRLLVGTADGTTTVFG